MKFEKRVAAVLLLSTLLVGSSGLPRACADEGHKQWAALAAANPGASKDELRRAVSQLATANGRTVQEQLASSLAEIAAADRDAARAAGAPRERARIAASGTSPTFLLGSRPPGMSAMHS